MHLYQIVVLSISIIMIYQGIKNYVRGKSGQTVLKLAVRLVVWGGMSFIAVYPSFTTVLARVVGLEGNMNTVILSGFLLVFLMIFKLLSAIERLEQSISEITRKESLKDINPK